MAQDARRSPSKVSARFQHRLPLRMEGLEDRITPVYTATLAGTTATFLGDAAGDALNFTVSGGLLQHNRFTAGDAGFASNFDFDTAVAGDQTLTAAAPSRVDVSAGDGDDTISLGDGVDLRGTLDGGIGTNTLTYANRTATTSVTANLGLSVSGMTGALGSDQEVPPTNSTATGSVTVTNYNPATRTFDISVTVDGVAPADVTGFHIHRAPVGVNGPVIINLQPLGALTPSGTGFTFNASGVPLPAEQEAAFLGGITYINVHTAAFPTGIIRGQLFSTGNVHVATGTATGTVSITNIQNAIGGPGDDSLVGNKFVNVLTGNGGNDTIVGAPGNDTMSGGDGTDVMVWSNGDNNDLIDGNAGDDTVQVNGSVNGDDEFTVAGNAARVKFDRTNLVPFTLDIGTTESLKVNGIGGKDKFTVNDMTTVAGLTRLDLNGFIGDDSFVFAATAGAAAAFVHGGPGADSLTGTNSGLTYDVTGPNAGVVPGLVGGFSFVESLIAGTGNDTVLLRSAGSLSGSVDGGGGTDLLDYEGTTGVSVNLGANSPGLTGALGSDQEVPATSSTATGTATVANYNPATETFDITVTVDGLAPADVTGFHIHRAPVGVNGPIIIDFVALGAVLTPTATGFTATLTGVALPSEQEAAFLGGITYVNIHTAAFPNGAIRGQLFPSAPFVDVAGAATRIGGALTNVENADGTDGDDSLVGTNGINILRGFGGNDTIVGTKGNDTMSGGDGSDVMVWSNGDNNDQIDGDAGDDTVQVNGAVTGDDIFTVVGNGARGKFDRTNLVPFTLDIGTTESLTVNGIGGNDKFSVGAMVGVADLSTVRLNGFAGDDSFTVAPSATAKVIVTGGLPNAAPGDALTVDLAGTTTPAINVTAANGDSRTGSWTFGNRQRVDFAGVEAFAPTADLSVTIADAPDPATAGKNVTYTVTVTNNGASDALNVQLSDLLPANTTLVSFTAPAGWSTSTSTTGVSATIATLATGSGPQAFTLVVTLGGATGGTTVTNTATVSSATDPVPANNSAATTTAVIAAADVSVTVTNGVTSVTAGSATTYTIVVTNPGPSPVTGVTFATTLPTSLTGVVFTATGAGGAAGFTASGTGSITNTLTLPAGATVTYVLTGTVSAIASGTLTVTAAATTPAAVSDPNTANNTATDADTITPPRSVLIGVSNYATGQDTGGGNAKFLNTSGDELFNVTPFEGFTGGVRVATGDFNADGTPDLAVGTGPGRATRVVVLDGKTKAELFSVDPFEAAFTGGVYIALGDTNADGFADLVVTPDQGGGPRVRVFDGKTKLQITDFLGIEDKNFRGGARAALADVDGDGKSDLVVAAGFGGGPRVAVFKGATLGVTLEPGALPPKLFGDILVFEDSLRNGVFIAAGDVNGDGLADIIAGGGPGGGPRVRIADGKTLLAGGVGKLDVFVETNPSVQLGNFFAGDVSKRGGIRVTVKDLNGDARGDIVTGAGSEAGSRVIAYSGAAIPAQGTPPELDAFDAFTGFTGGVFVG